MKAIFISHNQALNDRVLKVLDKANARGFTRWIGVEGRGSRDGEPHYGNHAWPGINTAVITIVRDEQVQPILDELRYVNDQAPQHGLRAFVWDATEGM